MGRREQAAEIRSTWMVMREPPDLTGNRHVRRKRLAEMRKARTMNALARIALPDVPISVRAVESSEVCPPAPRDSAAPTEGG